MIILPYFSIKSNEPTCNIPKEQHSIMFLYKHSSVSRIVTLTFRVSLFRCTQLTHLNHNLESRYAGDYIPNDESLNPQTITVCWLQCGVNMSARYSVAASMPFMAQLSRSLLCQNSAVKILQKSLKVGYTCTCQKRELALFLLQVEIIIPPHL